LEEGSEETAADIDGGGRRVGAGRYTDADPSPPRWDAADPTAATHDGAGDSAKADTGGGAPVTPPALYSAHHTLYTTP
jgi:hypothetical protein